MYFDLVPQRFWLVAASFFISLLLFVDCVCVTTPTASSEAAIELSDLQTGAIMGAFGLGYALMQVPLGLLVDKHGGRRVLTAVLIVFSIFTGLTACAWNFISLAVLRFLFGASAAGVFPGIARIAYSWLPLQERGLATGISFAGSRLGAAVAIVLLPTMFVSFGWRQSLLAMMVVGFVAAFYWWTWFWDDPEAHHFVSRIELKRINLGRPTDNLPSDDDASIGQLLRSSTIWQLMGQSFASQFTFFFCLTRLYPYVRSTFRLDTVATSMYAMAPLFAGAIGSVLAGWLIDRWYGNDLNRWSRKLPAIIGFALVAFGLVMCAHQSTAFGSVACLSLAIFGADMTLTPSWTYCIDIGRTHTGAIGGLMSMAGNLGAALVGLAFPTLIQPFGVAGFFYLGAAINLVAAGIWFSVQPQHQSSPTLATTAW